MRCCVSLPNEWIDQKKSRLLFPTRIVFPNWIKFMNSGSETCSNQPPHATLGSVGKMCVLRLNVLKGVQRGRSHRRGMK